MGGLPPGEFEHRAHQSHEKATMTDERDPVLGPSLLIFVAGKQFRKHLIGTRLAFFVRLIGTVPPACFIQIVWKRQRSKVLHEKGTRSAR